MLSTDTTSHPTYHPLPSSATNTIARDYDMLRRQDKQYDSNKIAKTEQRQSHQIAKIKPNQATYERGFVLATPVTPDEIKSPNSKKE
jgi:hypothetical protein